MQEEVRGDKGLATSAWQLLPAPHSMGPSGMPMSSPAPARSGACPASDVLAGADANLASIAQRTPTLYPLTSSGQKDCAKGEGWLDTGRDLSRPLGAAPGGRGRRPGTEHLPEPMAPPALQPVTGLLFPSVGGTGSTEGSLWVCPEHWPRGQALAEA